LFVVRSPEMPQYTINNLNPTISMGMPTTSLLGGQTVSFGDVDLQQTTMASQATLSGGNMQYTPISSQQVISPPQAPLHQPINQAPQSLPLNPHTIQMLAQSGLFNAQQPSQAPVPQQQGTDVQQQQNELLKQILLQVLTNQGGQQPQQQINQQAHTIPVSTSDPNMQSVEMPSLNSLDQNLLSLMTGESPMASLAGFSGFDGLSGTDLDCDPNVAGFETVGGDSNVNE